MKGGAPIIKMKRMTPAVKISAEAGLYGKRAKYSGHMYASVPEYSVVI
jgi:hypothetical protein